MDTLIAPATAGTVVTDSDNNHHDNGHHTSYFLHLATNAAMNSQAAQVAIERVGRSAELATEKTAAANALAAAVNTAAVQAAIAACCCEQKELVREEANKTRELILATEANRIRDLLSDAKDRIIVLEGKTAKA